MIEARLTSARSPPPLTRDGLTSLGARGQDVAIEANVVDAVSLAAQVVEGVLLYPSYGRFDCCQRKWLSWLVVVLEGCDPRKYGVVLGLLECG